MIGGTRAGRRRARARWTTPSRRSTPRRWRRSRGGYSQKKVLAAIRRTCEQETEGTEEVLSGRPGRRPHPGFRPNSCSRDGPTCWTGTNGGHYAQVADTDYKGAQPRQLPRHAGKQLYLAWAPDGLTTPVMQPPHKGRRPSQAGRRSLRRRPHVGDVCRVQSCCTEVRVLQQITTGAFWARATLSSPGAAYDRGGGPGRQEEFINGCLKLM